MGKKVGRKGWAEIKTRCQQSGGPPSQNEGGTRVLGQSP